MLISKSFASSQHICYLWNTLSRLQTPLRYSQLLAVSTHLSQIVIGEKQMSSQGILPVPETHRDDIPKPRLTSAPMLLRRYIFPLARLSLALGATSGGTLKCRLVLVQ